MNKSQASLSLDLMLLSFLGPALSVALGIRFGDTEMFGRFRQL
jgi:hypothetical protein